jgi:ATP-dependent Lon protease
MKNINQLNNKIDLYKNVIQNTIINLQKYKLLDLISANDLNQSIHSLEKNFIELNQINNNLKNVNKIKVNKIIEELNDIHQNVQNIIKHFGTNSFTDFVDICIPNNLLDSIEFDDQILKLLKQYFHPVSYKFIKWSNEKSYGTTTLSKNKILEDFTIAEKSKNLDCFDLARTVDIFQLKVYGIKVAIHSEEEKATYLVAGLVDDILINCIDSEFIKNKLKKLKSDKPNEEDFKDEAFVKFTNSLTLKELLIFSNDELYNKYVSFINQLILSKQKSINQIIKEFVNADLFNQRKTLIQLLLKSNEHEYQYLSYLLYDLLTNDNNGNVDTVEQTILFDSLPWNVKKYFKEAMKQTIQYTNNLSNYEHQNIPLEQQICLLKAPDNVKEKAMTKLKEIKSKSDDSGSKSRQYLEGLLKIPFGIFKKEEILLVSTEIKSEFKKLLITINNSESTDIYDENVNFTNIHIKNTISEIEKNDLLVIKKDLLNNIFSKYYEKKRADNVINILFINNLIKKYNLNFNKLIHSGKKCDFMQKEIENFIKNNYQNKDICKELCLNKNILNSSVEDDINKHINEINQKWSFINNYMKHVNEKLNESVHGHDNAKRQLERIFAQWINGEQSGYCFGFEGPPGVGKTSLAKRGIANCLIDENNNPRPFSFIAIGGQDNGSTLNGHNYTYVGSEWGKIVDILMKSKCMNPIIFIDELDKVSKTEHGKEIIGILTHLIDYTQNDSFQDKYFNGIDIDLSKALFIFSYNDASIIDRILLDRIHRIKFDHLSLEDKITITRKHILPEIYGKMGLENVIEISDENIIYIIDQYTMEPGVRKFKELLFEIIGEINLSNLKNDKKITLPIKITNDDIKYKYLKERHPIKEKTIPLTSQVGIMNGLWANALGQGGVIPIEVKYFPSNTFLELKLTGLQGDVMKESMNVAKTLAWSLLEKKIQIKNVENYEKTKTQGIHIHCPEGSVPKDGPSAGTAITTAIYSLFSNKKIKNNFAITGEINLQGNITAIGGLDLKILGGIKAGVKNFIYPEENRKDFDEFIEKYGEKEILNGILFHEKKHISEVFEIIFEE